MDGSSIRPNDQVYSGLTVLPMGFSWSFWIVQQLHQDLIASCGFPSSRCLVGSWPAPDIRTGAVAMPYCDNLTIFALSQEEADSGLQQAMQAFEEVGFSYMMCVGQTRPLDPLGLWSAAKTGLWAHGPRGFGYFGRPSSGL
eukprot:4142948-Karenia_brevis.AAC.1